MRIVRLELRDFRSYEHLVVGFPAGTSVLIGRNAQGKTNLLEAVHYLAGGSSHRVAADQPLVRRGAEAAIIRAVALTDAGRTLNVEYELRPGGRSRARVGGQQQARAGDAIGLVRSVLFAPEDVGVVRGDPADRRRFLDELLTARRPAYGAARTGYDRILRQRNALLRGARQRGDHPGETLGTWTAALVAAGSALLAARIALVHALAGPTRRAYEDLLGSRPSAQVDVGLCYQLSTGRRVDGREGGGVPDPQDLAIELYEGLEEMAEAEYERGITLAGPHRDDLVIELGGLPAKGFASQGETWSLLLALRLAGREVLYEVGDEPIVLLDDVFAELDDERRERLAAHCRRFGQVLVTGAVDDDVPLDGPRFRVQEGTVIVPPEMAQDAERASEMDGR